MSSWIRRLTGRERRPGHDFVIFAQGRTGSSLLRSLLSSHPEVHCDGEILDSPVGDPVGHVAAAAAARRASCHGFKVKIYQLTDTQGTAVGPFLDAMEGQGRRIVYLHRSNLLRHALSNIFAERRGRYHDHETGERPRLQVDPATVVDTMQRRLAHLEREQAALAGRHHLDLEYEEDLLDPVTHQRTADRVFAHLDLPSHPVATRLERSVSGSLRDRIENHEELREVVAASRFAHHLDDPRYG